MRGPTKNAALPTVASPSNLVAVGRKLDRIHNYEANLLEEDNRQWPSRRSPGRSMYGVSCRCDGPLIWGNGFGSLRRSYKSPTTDRSRGRHPRLRPLKRVCWSELTMAGSPPNRPHASHGSLSFPTRLRLRMHNTACRRRIAFGQHSLEKVDHLQFAPLRGHILIRKISPSHA